VALSSNRYPPISTLIEVLKLDDSLGRGHETQESKNSSLETLCYLPEPSGGMDAWVDLIGMARENALSLTLATALKGSQIPQGAYESLRTDAISLSSQAVTVAAHIRQLAQAFEAHKIPALFYKGVPLSLLTTGKMDTRGGGDVDLLVEESDLVRAHELLCNLGYSSAFGITPYESKPWKLYKTLHKESLYRSEYCDVDLHWRPLLSKGTVPSFEEILSRSVVVHINSTPLQTMSVSDSLVLMCAAFYLDNCRSIKQLVDIRRLSLLANGKTPSGYSAQLVDLEVAVVAFCKSLFEHSDPYLGLNRVQRRWLREVTKYWNSTIEPEGVRTTTPIVSMKIHSFALGFELKTGWPLSNGLRYVVGRCFEFRHHDFSKPSGLLWSAFRSEISFQLRNRFRR
jgi:hypothetical protein